MHTLTVSTEMLLICCLPLADMFKDDPFNDESNCFPRGDLTSGN